MGATGLDDTRWRKLDKCNWSMMVVIRAWVKKNCRVFLGLIM